MKMSDLFRKTNVNYYREQNSFFEKDFKDCIDIIENFFRLGKKDRLYNDLLQKNNYRIKHSTSLLYLGACIVNNLNLDMTISVGNKTFKFNHYWSLLCLFHDLGYCIEENIFNLYKIRKNNLKVIIENNEKLFYSNYIQKTLKCEFMYKRSFVRSIDQLIYWIQENTNIDIIRSRYGNIGKLSCIKFPCLNTMIYKSQYLETTINSYFRYREDEFGCVDHGIIGGYIFFDRFLKNYIQIMNERECEDSFNHFYVGNIHFRIEQIPLFAYISDCIVAHNIFLPDEEKKEIYASYGLEELCKAERIDFNKNPVLLLFCLVDAIDPIKFFMRKEYNHQPMEILKNIDMIFKENNEICIELVQAFFSDEEIEEYTRKVKDTTGWLNICVEVSNNSIKLKFLK